MKYKYPFGEVVSVPAPKELTPPPPAVPVDTVQDLINRKQEAEKNRYKYHLTEADCNLICTNATELHFSTGQVIADAGAHITVVYRIKAGRVALMKGDVKLFELSHGYFIGEGLFIRGEAKDIFGAALVASGPVILHEVNLPFVRQLLEVDKVLAFKVYRHMASKLSALLFNGISKLSNEIVMKAHGMLTRSDSSSSNSSNTSDEVGSNDSGSSTNSPAITASPSTPSKDSSSSSSSSSTPTTPSTPVFTGSERDYAYPPKAVIMSSDMVSARARKTKPVKQHKIRGPKLVAFKTYNLDLGQCLLDTKKLTITGCGFRHRKKIKYTKIVDLSRTGKNSVTIIFNFQAVSLIYSFFVLLFSRIFFYEGKKTLFFKTEDELNEFFGLVQSLVHTNVNAPSLSSSASSSSLTSSPSLSSLSSGDSMSSIISNPAYPLHISDEAQSINDKAELRRIAVRQDLVKGDIVVAEGDLYQRLYIVAQGQCVMRKGNRALVTVEEGEVFGVLTLFHLRPSMLTIEVTSDTATLLIIPAYKFQELITTNFNLSVRLHKKAAQLVYAQIEKALLSREGTVKGFGDPEVAL